MRRKQGREDRRVGGKGEGDKKKRGEGSRREQEGKREREVKLCTVASSES